MPDPIADFMNDPTQPIEFAELFLADPRVTVDSEGLIWKPMLRTGTWVEGPNGRPFKVVAGKGSDHRKQIVGIQDVYEAFMDGAHENVTVPLTHDDRTDENTGFVRKMRVHVGDDGSTWLLGGHDFTEPDIREKVLRGTIPNSSAGLRFDYRRREDGKHYPAVMRHNALTPHPLMNRLAPFGVNADESQDTYNLHSLQFSETPVEDDVLREYWQKMQSVMTDTSMPVMDRVDAVKKIISETPALSEDSTSAPSENISNTSTAGEEPRMADENKNENENGTGAPPATPPVSTTPPVAETNPFVLAEDPQFKALEAENKKLRDERAQDKAQLDQLLAGQRKTSADAAVTALKGMGFTEENGCSEFLQEIHKIYLADQGEAVILLADEEGAAPRPVGAIDLVTRLIGKLPKKDDGTLAMLAEQATDPLRRSHETKPPREGEEEHKPSSEEDTDAVFAEMFPGRVVPAASNGNAAN